MKIMIKQSYEALFYYIRILWNMSQFNLIDDNPFKITHMPNLTHTLLLIETNRYLPIHSQHTLNHQNHPPQQEEDNASLSLENQLRKGKVQSISSGILGKKKKVGCTCKKTKCLKMYCQCFATQKMCSPQCSCHSCSNTHNHIDSINKAKSIIKQKALSLPKQNVKGCSCKRTHCQKKYCECYNLGIPCGEDCKCQECANDSNSHFLRNNKEQKPI